MNEPHNPEITQQTPEARFGAVLRGLRVRAGLTLRGLGEQLHRSYSTISDFEKGVRLPAVDVVEQYEDYFKLPRGTLVAQRERARAERLQSPQDGTVDEHLGDIACPYKGLQPFERTDADVFFGRENQIAEVLERLAVTRFVAVVGASGSGKSSFARAGLLAGITQQTPTNGPRPRIALLTPGEQPLRALVTAVNAATDGAARVLSDDLRADPTDLRLAAHHARDGGLVIAVDQFEELFTQCDDEAERRCFVDALLAAWRDPASPVSVIIALRADFYGRVARYPDLAAAVVADQTLIGPMTPVELRRVIELPAAHSGLTLQPGLTDTMLDDLTGEPGALPLLSHALLETWQRRQRLTLTVSAYREAGGVRGAIAQTAERTLQRLPEADQAIARQIFLSLTDIGLSHRAETTEPTRRRVDLAEFAACVHRHRNGVLGILAAARLVTIDEHTVTVAHEALIRHWPRLRGWIETDRADLHNHRRLTAAAREWDTLHREPAALYRGVRLATANEWAADHPDHLTGLEREFLTASQTLQQHELEVARRRTRRLRALATGLAALTAIVTILAAWALEQRRTARHETAQASSVALASSASASSLLRSRPDISLLLAYEAVRASPRAEARSSMVSALQAIRTPRLLAIMRGHTSVGAPAFSPDGHTLAFSDDTTIRLCDTRTHKQIGALKGHTKPVGSIAFSPDGHTLVSAGFDMTVRFWDMRTHRQIAALLTHAASSLAFSADGHTLASGGDDGTIRLWNTSTHKQVGKPLTGHTNFVYRLAFSPVGHRLASIGEDMTTRLWDTITHKQIGTPFKGVSSVAFSPDGHTLATGGDRTIRLRNTSTFKQIGPPLKGHTDIVQGVAFRPDGHTLASASSDKTVRLWNTHTHTQIGAPFKGHTDIVSEVAFSADGHTLVSASDDKTVRLWDARVHRRRYASLAGHTGSVTRVAFSPDGRTLASASDDKTVRLWNTTTHKQIGKPLAGHTGAVTRVAFSPDGRTLASASDDKTVRLWNTTTHKQIGLSTLSSADADRTARLWGARRRKQFERSGGRRVPSIPDLVTGVAFSRDLHTLATVRQDSTIWLWDVRTGKQIGKPLTGHPRGVVSGVLDNVAFSPDGHTLASDLDDGPIRLWNTRTHKQIGAPLKGHTQKVTSVAFSPDGQTLASSSWDGTTRLWDLRTHKQLGGPITNGSWSVAFSPDGQTLTSAGLDDAVRLWDVHSHKQLGSSLTSNRHEIGSVAFSPDGRTVTASGGKTIPLWDILWHDFTDLQTEVCKLVATGLSKTEWAQYASGIPYRQSCP
jgi:WD40 repeat protein/transcriptional regulator with XRE-family HTH domain